MTRVQARALRNSDHVYFKNGPHKIPAVVYTVSEDKNGPWVYIIWANSKGKGQTSRKRPAALTKGAPK